MLYNCPIYLSICISKDLKGTMADKLMYITNDDTRNSFFFKLQLVVEMFGYRNNANFTKVPKVVKPTNKKTLLKTLGAS